MFSDEFELETPEFKSDKFSGVPEKMPGIPEN